MKAARSRSRTGRNTTLSPWSMHGLLRRYPGSRCLGMAPDRIFMQRAVGSPGQAGFLPSNRLPRGKPFKAPDQHTTEDVRRAGLQELIGLAVRALPCLLYAMDLTVLHLAV